MKTPFLYLAFIFLFLRASGATKDTLIQIGGPNTDHVTGSGVDNAGNIVAAGIFSSTLWVKDSLKPLSSANPVSIFIVKTDPAGHLIWQRAFDNKGDVSLFSYAMDDQGNSYLGGYFKNSLSLDAQTVTGDANQAWPFVAKVDSAGKAVWIKSYKVWGGYCNIGKIFVDGSQNVYVSCFFYDSIRAESTTFKSPGENSLLVKYDASGTMAWGKITNTIIRSFSADNAGNIYIAGAAGFGKFMFGGVAHVRTDTSRGLILAKFNGAGNLAWFKVIPCGGQSVIVQTAVDPKGNIFAAGHFSDSLRLPGKTIKTTGTAPNDADIFVLSFDSSGKVLWSKTYGSTGVNYVQAAGMDHAGNLFVTGNFKGSLSFGPKTLTSAGQDLYIMKIDMNGNLLGAGNTNSGKFFSQVNATQVFFNAKNRLHIAGYFNAITVFGGTQLYFRGGDDGFVWIASDQLTGISPVAEPAASTINLFPNPAHGNNITLQSAASIKQIQLYDLSGKMIINTYNPVFYPDQEVQFDISALKKGFYLVKIQTAEGIETAKFVRE
jgi:hypothetical protein